MHIGYSYGDGRPPSLKTQQSLETEDQGNQKSIRDTYYFLTEVPLKETQADKQAKNPPDKKDVLMHTHFTYVINHLKENLLGFLTAKERMSGAQRTEAAVHVAGLDTN